MPLQNRVDPLAELHAVPERGTVMGNRGILHNAAGDIVRYHAHKHWIICQLDWVRGDGTPVQRQVMGSGYTELFFLDEATALAAGHRPCGSCSWEKYHTFRRLFEQANPDHPGHMDDLLHHDRFVPYRRNVRTKKRTYTAPVASLPDGTFVLLEPDPSTQPYLVRHQQLYRWFFDGYGPAQTPRPDQEVTVLTPAATVRTLAAGYRPAVFPEGY